MISIKEVSIINKEEIAIKLTAMWVNKCDGYVKHDDIYIIYEYFLNKLKEEK